MYLTAPTIVYVTPRSSTTWWFVVVVLVLLIFCTLNLTCSRRSDVSRECGAKRRGEEKTKQNKTNKKKRKKRKEEKKEAPLPPPSLFFSLLTFLRASHAIWVPGKGYSKWPFNVGLRISNVIFLDYRENCFLRMSYTRKIFANLEEKFVIVLLHLVWLGSENNSLLALLPRDMKETRDDTQAKMFIPCWGTVT